MSTSSPEQADLGWPEDGLERADDLSRDARDVSRETSGLGWPGDRP